MMKKTIAINMATQAPERKRKSFEEIIERVRTTFEEFHRIRCHKIQIDDEKYAKESDQRPMVIPYVTWNTHVEYGCNEHDWANSNTIWRKMMNISEIFRLTYKHVPNGRCFEKRE